MSKAINGDPEIDGHILFKFIQVHALLAEAVTETLVDKKTVRNLGQETLDDVEVLLREIRIGVDRGLVVFAKRRTVRTKQAVGGAFGTVNKRLTDLEAATKQSDEIAPVVMEADEIAPLEAD